MKQFYSVVFALTSLLSCSAYAHDDVINYNQISLEASASAEVENDTMVVSLYAQEEGSKATELSNRVNQKINWALEKLKQYPNIKVETESYSTVPVYSKSQVIAWRVKQSIQLESKDMALMSEVLGELQRQLNLNGISFDVSPEKRDEQTRLLIDQALTAYNNRARQIANKLQHDGDKHDGYKIVTMNVSTSEIAGQYRHRPMAMMAEAASSIAPEIAKGDQTLTVRVSGTIELE
ncbi:MAG: SIMPL domain-containing protein [Gammaproteobacteria bacterium]|jgi:predicted secreted protein|nr:SIMPL domain-containing protein [Gammaproteobacteria bacterium]